MENNNENRNELAQQVLDSWDMDTLLGFAFDVLTDAYKADDVAFKEDCELMNDLIDEKFSFKTKASI